MSKRAPRKTMPPPSADRTPEVTARTADGVEAYAIVEVHRSELKDAPYNPRVLSMEARERLKKGIKKVGLLSPPTWNKTTGNIVSGHQRVSILDSIMGKADYTLRVAQVEMDPVREREANILMNNPEAQGEWDLEKLEGMLHTEGLNLDATGFDMADVYRLFGDVPASDGAVGAIDELADRLAAAHQSHSDIQSSAAARDSDDFYIVVVFKDTLDREEFLAELGLDSNRYQDGRKIRALCTEAGNLQPRELEADSPVANQARERKEIRKLRELIRHYTEGKKCSMCGEPLVAATAYVGHEPGSGHGRSIPEVTDLAEHHIDGQHHNNAIENREIVHHRCHKSFHGNDVRRYR